jgi:L-lactate dehydrogenase complex protein LldG
MENLRSALGRTPLSPLGPRPPILPARQEGNMDVEIERFLEEIRKLSGSAQRMRPQAVGAGLRLLAAEEQIRKAAVWRTPGLAQLGVEPVLRSLGVEVAPPHADKHALAQCDLGVTEADFLLAETGTLALRSSADKPRAVSLLPRIHLAIVRPELLRPDLHSVFAEAKDSPYLLFVTGPSRTADIELTVTLGVHGPKSLHVWMVDA